MTYKDAGEMMKAADLMDQASTMYLEHGTPDTAALALDRAAKYGLRQRFTYYLLRLI